MQVNFPLQLDLYEFCSDEYKKELQGPREAQQQVYPLTAARVLSLVSGCWLLMLHQLSVTSHCGECPPYSPTCTT